MKSAQALCVALLDETRCVLGPGLVVSLLHSSLLLESFSLSWQSLGCIQALCCQLCCLCGSLALFVYQLLRLVAFKPLVLNHSAPRGSHSGFGCIQLGVVRVSALCWIVPLGNQLAMSFGCQ